MEATESYPRVREQISPYTKETFCLLNFPAGCSVACTGSVVLVQGIKGRIRLCLFYFRNLGTIWYSSELEEEKLYILF